MNTQSPNVNLANVKQLLVYSGFILIVSLAQYSLSLQNRFVWDAEIIFTGDPTLRDLKNLPLSFQEQTNVRKTNEGNKISKLAYYRPLAKSLRILEYPLFGTDPLGYKAVNVILNAAVVLLLFVVVFSATKHPTVALVAALLYAVNPVRAEVVYWTYSDSYILMSFFSLGSLALYQRRHIILALIAFFLSLFCHEMAVLLPVIILLYTFLIERQQSIKAYVPSLLFFVLAGAFLVLRTAIMGSVPLGGVEAGTFLNTAVVVIQRYTKMFFLPDAPVTIYARQLFVSLTPEVVISYVVVGLLAAFGVWLWFRRRAYLFWYLWFFIWSAVSLNIGAFSEYLMAEKILYLACAGFCVLLALLMVEFADRKVLVYGLLGCLVVLHSATTFARAAYWQDTRTYLQKGLEFAPDSFLTHYALGRDYVKTLEYDKALAQFIHTIALNPRHSYSYNGMGNIYYLQNDMDRAISAWEKSITIDPEDPVPYYNIGLAFKKKYNLSRALFYFEKYLALSPQPDPRILDDINKLRTMLE